MTGNKGKYDWWDWTSFAAANPGLMDRVRALTAEDLQALSRDGFKVTIYDTREEFFLAEALEYVEAFKRATADAPVGVCGPVGPTEQLPLVAVIINSLEIDVRHAHFAGMDEFMGENGRAIPRTHPLSFAATDLKLCFGRIKKRLRMPDSHLHFPTEKIRRYIAGFWDDLGIEVACTQGGQGNTKHFAFNDPFKCEGRYVDEPPTPDEYAALCTRIVDLHPCTIVQDARHSNNGEEWLIPSRAVTVGPKEVLNRSKCVSIWHPGWHDNPIGIRLTAYMISENIVDARVPMSLLARHPNVRFNYLRSGIGSCGVDMH